MKIQLPVIMTRRQFARIKDDIHDEAYKQGMADYCEVQERMVKTSGIIGVDGKAYRCVPVIDMPMRDDSKDRLAEAAKTTEKGEVSDNHKTLMGYAMLGAQFRKNAETKQTAPTKIETA